LSASKNGRARRDPSGREMLSTLITRAPSRERTSPASGPAHNEARFATTSPSSELGGAVPAGSVRIGRRSVVSSTSAHANPSRTAVSTTSRERRSATARPIAAQNDNESGSTPNHAGIEARSCGLGILAAIHPSRVGNRRVPPPLLDVVDGRIPSSAARPVTNPSPRLPTRSPRPAPRSSRYSTR
jgi:hypothetical protein